MADRFPTISGLPEAIARDRSFAADRYDTSKASLDPMSEVRRARAQDELLLTSQQNRKLTAEEAERKKLSDEESLKASKVNREISEVSLKAQKHNIEQAKLANDALLQHFKGEFQQKWGEYFFAKKDGKWGEQWLIAQDMFEMFRPGYTKRYNEAGADEKFVKQWFLGHNQGVRDALLEVAGDMSLPMLTNSQVGHEEVFDKNGKPKPMWSINDVFAEAKTGNDPAAFQAILKKVGPNKDAAVSDMLGYDGFDIEGNGTLTWYKRESNDWRNANARQEEANRLKMPLSLYHKQQMERDAAVTQAMEEFNITRPIAEARLAAQVKMEELQNQLGMMRIQGDIAKKTLEMQGELSRVQQSINRDLALDELSAGNPKAKAVLMTLQEEVGADRAERMTKMHARRMELREWLGEREDKLLSDPSNFGRIDTLGNKPIVQSLVDRTIYQDFSKEFAQMANDLENRITTLQASGKNTDDLNKALVQAKILSLQAMAQHNYSRGLKAYSPGNIIFNPLTLGKHMTGQPAARFLAGLGLDIWSKVSMGDKRAVGREALAHWNRIVNTVRHASSSGLSESAMESAIKDLSMIMQDIDIDYRSSDAIARAKDELERLEESIASESMMFGSPTAPVVAPNLSDSFIGVAPTAGLPRTPTSLNDEVFTERPEQGVVPE